MDWLNIIKFNKKRFLYNDFKSSYYQLSEQAGKTTMLISRLKTLEIYKTINRINPTYAKYFRKIQLQDFFATFKQFRDATSKPNKFWYKKSKNAWAVNLERATREHKIHRITRKFLNNYKKWEGPNCNCSVCRFLFSQS